MEGSNCNKSQSQGNELFDSQYQQNIQQAHQQIDLYQQRRSTQNQPVYYQQNIPQEPQQQAFLPAQYAMMNHSFYAQPNQTHQQDSNNQHPKANSEAPFSCNQYPNDTFNFDAMCQQLTQIKDGQQSQVEDYDTCIPQIYTTEIKNSSLNNQYNFKFNQEYKQEHLQITENNQNILTINQQEMHQKQQYPKPNQEIYYDNQGQVNKLTDLQDPSDSASNFNHHYYNVANVLNDDEEDIIKPQEDNNSHSIYLTKQSPQNTTLLHRDNSIEKLEEITSAYSIEPKNYDNQSRGAYSLDRQPNPALQNMSPPVSSQMIQQASNNYVGYEPNFIPRDQNLHQPPQYNQAYQNYPQNQIQHEYQRSPFNMEHSSAQIFHQIQKDQEFIINKMGHEKQHHLLQMSQQQVSAAGGYLQYGSNMINPQHTGQGPQYNVQYHQQQHPQHSQEQMRHLMAMNAQLQQENQDLKKNRQTTNTVPHQAQVLQQSQVHFHNEDSYLFKPATLHGQAIEGPHDEHQRLYHRLGNYVENSQESASVPSSPQFTSMLNNQLQADDISNIEIPPIKNSRKYSGAAQVKNSASYQQSQIDSAKGRNKKNNFPRGKANSEKNTGSKRYDQNQFQNQYMKMNQGQPTYEDKMQSEQAIARKSLPGQVGHQSDGGKAGKRNTHSAKGMNFNGLMPSIDVEDDHFQKNPVHSTHRKSSGDKSSNQNTKMINDKTIKKRKVSEQKLGTTNTDSSNSGLDQLQIPKKQPSQGSQKSQTNSRGNNRLSSRGGKSNSSQGNGHGHQSTNSAYNSGLGTHSHASSQSYDEFIQNIQHEMKRANKDPVKQFEVLDKNIVKLASIKVGSLFLQDLIKNAEQPLINLIIEQIEDQFSDLMSNDYGNFFCKDLISKLDDGQRIRILKSISGQKLIDISCNKNGTYSIQKIIESITEDEEYRIIQETLQDNDNFVMLAKNYSGKHILEKILCNFPQQKRQYVFKQICDNFSEIATDQQGLVVLKKLIQLTDDQTQQKAIVKKILEDPLNYSKSEYGNFVVSEVLKQFDYQICREIFQNVKGNFITLSQNKFSSKFVEECIDRAPTHIQDEIIEEFCHSTQLHKVVQGNFGNYVIQKCLKVMSDQNVEKLLQKIIVCLKDVYDQKLQQKWGTIIVPEAIGKLKRKNPYGNKETVEKLNKALQAQMKEVNSIVPPKKTYEQEFSEQVDLKEDGYDGQYQQQKGGNFSKNNTKYQQNQQFYHAKMFNKKGNNMNKQYQRNQNQEYNDNQPTIFKKDHIKFSDNYKKNNPNQRKVERRNELSHAQRQVFNAHSTQNIQSQNNFGSELPQHHESTRELQIIDSELQKTINQCSSGGTSDKEFATEVGANFTSSN